MEVTTDLISKARAGDGSIPMKLFHAADLHVDSPLSGLEQYDGAPIAQRKTIHKTRLNRKGLEQEYPTIVARYITEYDETRLEFL